MRKNQQGFTLAEMIVGVALMGIMGMVAASFFYFTTKTKTEITNEIEDKVDNIIAERMFLKDLRSSEPSFNNVITPGDNGLPFFDFVMDAAEIPNSKTERVLTLEYGRRNEFIFLISNDKIGTMMYTPTIAYKIGPPPPNPNQEGSLQFVSLNRNREVERSRQGLWNPGAVLMLDSPAAIRQMTTSGPNYSVPARSPIFVGVVPALGETRLTPLNFPNLINRTNPMYPNETITDEDKFLRDIPPMGGAAPLVRLKAIHIIKYYLDKDKGTGKVNLYRSMFTAGAFTPGQVFAANVTRVVFSRNDATDSLIYYKIERPGDQNK